MKKNKRRLDVSDDPRRLAVARKVWEVQCSLAAFDFADENYVSVTVDEAMRETEAAFAADEYERAARLARITSYLIKRESPLMASNPQRWIEKIKEQQTYHKRKSFVREASV
jgi:hypothetical protein